MSVVYSVSLDIAYRDEAQVIAATQSFVETYGPRATFSDIDYSSVLSAVKIILPERGLNVTEDSEHRLICECDFNASYGWEGVMTDWFNYITQADCLLSGSQIKIYPDEGWVQGVSFEDSVEWSTDDGAAWNRSSEGISVAPIPAPEIHPYKTDDPELQSALDAINEYLTEEFGSDSIVAEEDDLANVGLMYTYAGDDDEYEVQVIADLINPSVSYYVNNELVEQDEFFDLGELTSYILHMDFDSYYNACVRHIDFDDEE